jgi:3-methylcrotonyl-CoA carboxylase alpha subunit
VRVDGRVAWTVANGDVRWVFLDGRVYEFADASPKTRRRRGSHDGGLVSPMPATVRRILVAPGDRVAKGDVLLLLEAMKMELPIRAAGPGVIRAVHCKDGELVQPGVPLIDLEEDA